MSGEVGHRNGSLKDHPACADRDVISVTKADSLLYDTYEVRA